MFVLNDKEKYYPSAEHILDLLRQHTHLDIQGLHRYEGEHLSRNTFICTQDVEEELKFDWNVNLIRIIKMYPHYTYLFYSMMRILTKLTVELGAGRLMGNFPGMELEISSIEDLKEFYSRAGFPKETYEASQYSYEEAQHMKGFEAM